MEEKNELQISSHPNSTPSSIPIVIGIAGGSGAGKTTLARALYEKLGQSENIAYLTHDDYYKDITHLSMEERACTNFDHPDSLDTALLVQHIQQLKVGQTVHVPNYDFSTHSRTSQVTVVHPKKIILVEGILIFSEPALVKELDIKVYCDAESDIRFMRRFSRDVRERGRTPEEVMKQFLTTVKPMHEQFVEPSKRIADMIVHSHGSSLTSDSSIVLNILCNHLLVETGLLGNNSAEK